ncbi:hypothetical protein A1Q1_02299 [Trichosporon asahii var. asahii CBS 2479]|uniref:Ubiquitin thioesterase OTU n=1 Tax=Trichosporon asahii var. asahii (strain ATCC 90039 / CBS 2479 / JCM 2466 / KCTC 7840 / NBRC 103889/ NCYC 2677 / UAMH 7654) TaxID=1186058 RepID=J6F0J1_TRIAS|nr:hypothetical protein A1Q1_02299 [Trichosporon asahii var. asahii CBS 2479]EJT48662.1 hypothetical protein A1Q1_02299 [Trichosporon asahii var. asahii CBS 2479]
MPSASASSNTVPVRLRHPRGVTTIEVDPEAQGIDDLKVLIFSASEIPPSQQEIKYGYPPKPLPETSGRLSSIPLTRGEQLIVTSNPNKLRSPSASPVRRRRPSVKELDAELSAPRSPPPRARDSPLLENEIPLETKDSVQVKGHDAGYIQLRIVPDDNSCLFSSVAVVFEGGLDKAQELRKGKLEADPEKYSDVMLGMPRDEYMKKILDKNTWGGAIELAIFSDHYKTEIASFDVATGRSDRFGEGSHENRCILVYSGIHYDAVTLSPLPVSPPEFHTTVYPVSNQAIMDAAQELVAGLKSRKYYTDTANFDLKCGVCGVGLKGEKGAREHAMQTGPRAFGSSTESRRGRRFLFTPRVWLRSSWVLFEPLQLTRRALAAAHPCTLRPCVCVPALTDAFVSHMAPLRAAPPFDLTPRVPLLHRVVDCLPFALTTMTTSPENVSSIADRLGRLKLTVEANLIDNEDLIGDAGDLPAPTVQPVIPVNSITSVTLAQNTPLPRSPPNDASAAPQSGTSDSNSSDPSFSSITTSELMTLGQPAQQTSGTSPSGDSESQTQSSFYLTTSASPFVRRSSLSHPSLILHPSTSQPASSTTHSSPSMTSQSTSSLTPASKHSTPSNLLPFATPFQPASQSSPSSTSSPTTFPLVTLAPTGEPQKISIKAPAATVSTAAMSDTPQQHSQPALQATPPKAQVSESSAQTPGWVCQTPVWVTAPEGVGMATPSPTLSSFQAPSPADTATSPQAVMSFNVPSPIKSVGDGSPSPTRTAFSFGSSMPAVFQPAAPAMGFNKPPPSKAVPITKPAPKASGAHSESVSLLGDIPEAEDLLTEDDSNDPTLADQLAKAKVLSAAPSSQASSTGPADLRPTHTPLDRNLYSNSETKIECKETPVLAPKSSKYGNISLAAPMTGSSVGQTTLVGDKPLQLPSESEDPTRSASAASLSSTPGKEVSVKALAAMYDQHAGKSGRSAVTPGFSDDHAQTADDAETVTGNESDTKDNSNSATLKRFSETGFGTEPLAIAAPGFRPQSSVYDADNETDTEASARHGKDTDTETEAPNPKVRKLAKDDTLSAGSATLDDITEKPFVPTVTKLAATQAKPVPTSLTPAINGLDEGKAEVEELERLWTDFKDGVAIFGGGIDEVIARLTKEFKNAVQIAAVAPATSTMVAASAGPAVDVKALEIKRQEFDDLRRKSEALRARALKAEGEAREAAERASALEVEVDASKKKSEADKERIEELTGLYDSSESLCTLLRKRNQSVGTERLTASSLSSWKEKVFDPEELARGYDGGSKWASRIRSETVRLCRLMNNDTEVPILMYLYFDIVGSLGSTVALTSQQKTLTELLEDVSQFDDFMEGFSSTEDLITVSDVSGAVGASVKIRVDIQDKGYVKDITSWPKSAQAKVYAARSTGADEADKDPFLQLGNDHLFYADCFFPRTFDQWSNEIQKTSGQRQAGEGAPQQPQPAATQQHLGQGAPPPQQQLQTQLAPENTPNPGPLDPNHTGLTARPGAFAGLQQPLNPTTQYGTPPPQASHTPRAPSQSPVAPMQPQQQQPPPPQAQAGAAWGQNRSATYSYQAPPQGPPQGPPQVQQQAPHAGDWGQRSSVGDGSPSPTRTAFSFGSSMPAVFQPAAPAMGFNKPPPSKAVPITKPAPKASGAHSESVSLLGDIPEAEDLLTEDDSNDPTLADQLAKAKVLMFQAQPQPQQQPQQPQQTPPQQPAQSQQPPWNQYGAAPPAQPQQPQKQPSPVVEQRQPQARRYNEVVISHARGYAGSIGGSPPSTDEDNPLLKDVPQTSRTFVSRPPQFARAEDPIQRPGSSNSLISMVSSAVHGRGMGPPPTFRVRDVSQSHTQPHSQPPQAPHAPQPAPVQAPPPWAQHGGVAHKVDNNNSDWRL